MEGCPGLAWLVVKTLTPGKKTPKKYAGKTAISTWEGRGDREEINVQAATYRQCSYCLWFLHCCLCGHREEKEMEWVLTADGHKVLSLTPSTHLWITMGMVNNRSPPHSKLYVTKVERDSIKGYYIVAVSPFKVVKLRGTASRAITLLQSLHSKL